MIVTGTPAGGFEGNSASSRNRCAVREQGWMVERRWGWRSPVVLVEGYETGSMSVALVLAEKSEGNSRQTETLEMASG